MNNAATTLTGRNKPLRNSKARSDARSSFALPLGLLVLIGAAILDLSFGKPAYAQAGAPSWSFTGNLSTARNGHTATLLQNGKVLVTGGNGSDGNHMPFSLNSSELYDPATGMWSTAGNLNTPRIAPTAMLLQSGKVLVFGGINYNNQNPSPLNSAELYDPVTGIWSFTGGLNTARLSFTATLLQNGKVLVAGGSQCAPAQGCLQTNSAELYDPATETWSLTDSLNTARSFHTTTLLANGKLLVVGGDNCATSQGPCSFLNSAELYDPATGKWSGTGSLNSARSSHTATLLQNGKVLVAGGPFQCINPNGDCDEPLNAELYDAATGVWINTNNSGIYAHTATVLPSGKILLVAEGDFAELYDPATGTFDVTAKPNTGRRSYTTTLLPNGKVLLAAGGVHNTPAILNTAELYDPGITSTPGPTPTPSPTPSPTPAPSPTTTPMAPASWTLTGNLNLGRDSHTATRLQNGKVLVAGGNGSNGTLKSAELYDPATGTWTNTSNLNTDRAFHTATLLSNGKVLVAAGFSCAPPPQVCSQLNSAEIYDPTTGTWSNAGNLNTARSAHTATLLLGGQVLVAGGFLGDGGVSEAELYEPATGTWVSTGNLNTGRYRHTATLLQTGKVLVVGGIEFDSGTGLNGAELYDAATGTWSNTGNLNTARAFQTATLLGNGKALVAGGFVNFDTGQVTNSAELYDPATGTWSPTGNLNTGRAYHTATLLLGGKILVAAGFFVQNLPNITNSAELYDPATGTWTSTASLNIGRRFHTATLLLNGKVLAAGGSGGGNTAELYDLGSEPSVLTADQVTLKSWTYQGRTYAYVKLSFPNSGYNVANWGQAVRAGNDFTADAAVERFTGASVQAITTTAQIYDLGPLSDGTYNFNFKTSGTLAKTLQFTVSSATPPPNPIDNAREFVKQQYRDFLNREADPAGEDFWTDNITKCMDPARRPAGQTEAQCTLRQRETTSGAFFLSPEFQYTGYFVYRMYQGGLGRQPKLSEFTADALVVGNGIVVNGQLSGPKINQNKADFAAQFVNCTDAAKYRCAEFKAIYDGLNNTQYVDKLFETTGVNASAADRAALVNELQTNPTTGRATVLQKVVDGVTVLGEGNQQFTTSYGQAFYNSEFNRAFVQLEYFGYMKRDPDDAGYGFWLGKLNQFGGNFVNAEMVLAFISSPEYRARFGQP